MVRFSSVAICVLLLPRLLPQAVHAQDLPSDQDRTATTIRLKNFPKPPPEFASLLKSGNVHFVTGGTPMLNPSDLPRGIRIAGETRFESRYRYNTNARWNVTSSGIELRVHFRSLKLVQKHVIWLKTVPKAEDFWTDRVVRHEFDHVRISADKRIEAQFRRDVQRMTSFTVPKARVTSNGKVDNAKVQEVIRQRVKQAFERISDYVDVRYLELDRVTQHGMLPLPKATEEPTMEAPVAY